MKTTLKHLSSLLLAAALTALPQFTHAVTLVDYGATDLVTANTNGTPGTLTQSGTYTNSYAYSGSVPVSPATGYSGVPIFGQFQTVGTAGSSALTIQWQNTNPDKLQFSCAQQTDTRLYALWFIKQTNFNNLTSGGVTFSASSSLTNALTGLNQGSREARFAVLAGAQWYLSSSKYTSASDGNFVIANLGAENFGVWNPTTTTVSSNDIPTTFATAGNTLTNIQAVGMWYYRQRGSAQAPSIGTTRFTVTGVASGVGPGAPTQVSVETAADGTGTVVPAQNVTVGNTLTVYAIARDTNGVFVSSTNATWSLVNKTGNVVDGDLAGSGSSATFTANNFGTANIRATVTGLTSVDSGTINVPAPINTWSNAPANFSWDTTSANWTGASAIYTNGHQVVFDDTGDATSPIDLVGTLTPGSVTVNSANNYTFSTTGSGKISGPTALAKSGNGSLTLATANDFSGGVTLSGGTLNINNASALGTGPFTLAAGTTIDNTSAGAITLSTTNAQTWNGGTVQFTGTRDLNLGSGTVTYGAARTVTVSANTLTVGPINGGSFGLTKSGAGTLTLSGQYTGGGVTVNHGTLKFTGSGALGSGNNVTVNANATDQTALLDLNGVSFTINTLNLGGTGGTSTSTNLVSTGSGILTLSGGNAIGHNVTGDPVGAVISGNIALVTGGTFPLNVTVSNSASATDDVTISANISGNTGFNKNGNGVLVISGTNNTFNGAAWVAEGTLKLGANDVIPAGLNLQANGGSTAAPAVTTATVDLAGRTDTVSSLGLGHTGARVSGNVNVLTDSAGTGLLKLAGNLTYNAGPAGSNNNAAATISAKLDLNGTNRTFTIGDSDQTTTELTVSAAIQNSTGTAGLIKAGAGTMVLSGANTYNGDTTVNNGILQIDSAFLPSAAGVSIGTNVVCRLELNFTGTNTVNTLRLNGTLQAAGVYNGTSSPGYLGGTGYLNVLSAGLPTVTNITYSVSGNQLTLNWPAGQGWRLQAQTNSLSAGISTNWSNVTPNPVPPTIITVDPAAPTVFYRLIAP